MSGPHLSDAQIAEYESQGFLVLRGLFEESELETWRKRFAAIWRRTARGRGNAQN